MLGELLGSINKERVLIFIAARDSGYASEIARFFAAPLNPIQKALDKLEQAGVLVSQSVGATRVYQFNPRYPLRKELQVMLAKALELYPAKLKRELREVRTRPRRRGKPA